MAEGKKFTIRRKVDTEGNLTDILELDMEDLPFKKHAYLDINFGKIFVLTYLLCD